jgi:hypothetical protein
MHHYNFPPYSTGETGRVGAPRRREIGHGALAERALLPVVPGDEEFPYALRIISEVLESNGSSSMASVCGSTLALMDGGVPIKAPVAGVAMGLVKEGEDYVIMSDIQGLEDHMGDMDFKVAGTRDGITALQMDMKITGVSPSSCRRPSGQAKTGRLEILDIHARRIAEPRAEVSEFAPRVEVLRIPKEKIGMLIGPGGKTINALQDQFGVNISVRGRRHGPRRRRRRGGQGGRRRHQGMMKDVEAGDIYNGKVVKTTNFGAFVELTPGRDGLVHISRLAPGKAAGRAGRGRRHRGRPGEGAGSRDRQAEPHLAREAGGLVAGHQRQEERASGGFEGLLRAPHGGDECLPRESGSGPAPANERDEVAGITHLMEHMLFKGPPELDALGIARPSRASAPRRTRRRARSTPCSTPDSCPSTSRGRST